jgi:hypothetical protein
MKILMLFHDFADLDESTQSGISHYILSLIYKLSFVLMIISYFIHDK